MSDCHDRIRENIKQNFKIMDTSGDGTLDRDEFCKCLKRVFPDMSAQQLFDLFNEVDTKASRGRGEQPDGKITLDEMIYFVLELKNPRELKQADIRALFNKYDKDGNGTLDLQEFLTMGRDAHYNLQEEHFKKCCGSQGKITAESFIREFPDCK